MRALAACAGVRAGSACVAGECATSILPAHEHSSPTPVCLPPLAVACLPPCAPRRAGSARAGRRPGLRAPVALAGSALRAQRHGCAHGGLVQGLCRGPVPVRACQHRCPGLAAPAPSGCRCACCTTCRRGVRKGLHQGHARNSTGQSRPALARMPRFAGHPRGGQGAQGRCDRPGPGPDPGTLFASMAHCRARPSRATTSTPPAAAASWATSPLTRAEGRPAGRRSLADPLITTRPSTNGDPACNVPVWP
jgi:hypothetical protein